MTLPFETGQTTWTLPLVLRLSVLAILLPMLMIRQGQVARVTSHFYLLPPLTALQAWLFFGEKVSALSAAGGAAAVAGVYLVMRRTPPSASASASAARA